MCRCVADSDRQTDRQTDRQERVIAAHLCLGVRGPGIAALRSIRVV